MAQKSSKGRIFPLILAAILLVIDQITKAWVVKAIPLGTKAWSWGGDFFYLTHQRNTGVAFSVGDALPLPVRSVLFLAVPLLVLIVLGIFYWRDKSLHGIQRWALALILGGGTGNLIDRAFRPHGVVDFLSFKFYGLFGLERWPTFNIADSMVVVGVGLLILSFLVARKPK
ncbi:MAG: signal peptidase II [Spirochaetales bacterium]|nr:signal peptidase II [Spirochaetales bacterium]